MTTQTETAETASASGNGAGFTTGIIITLAGCAVISWIGGLALHVGYGLSIPFAAGFFLVLAFLFFVRLTVLVAAGAWYSTVLAVTPRLVAAETATAAVTEYEAQRLLDAKGFLAMDKKIRGL